MYVFLVRVDVVALRIDIVATVYWLLVVGDMVECAEFQGLTM